MKKQAACIAFLAIGILLAGCVASPTPTPTPSASAPPSTATPIVTSTATPTTTPVPAPSVSPGATANPALCKTGSTVVSCCSFVGDPSYSCTTCLQLVGAGNEDKCYSPQPTPTPPAATATPSPTAAPSVTLESLRDAGVQVLQQMYGRTLTPTSTYGYGGDIASYYMAWHDSYPYYSIFVERFPIYRDKTYREPDKFGFNALYLTYNYSNGSQVVKLVDLADQQPASCHENAPDRPTCYQKIRMQCLNFTYIMSIEATEYVLNNPLRYEAERIASNMIPFCPD